MISQTTNFHLTTLNKNVYFQERTTCILTTLSKNQIVYFQERPIYILTTWIQYYTTVVNALILPTSRHLKALLTTFIRRWKGNCFSKCNNPSLSLLCNIYTEIIFNHLYPALQAQSCDYVTAMGCKLITDTSF